MESSVFCALLRRHSIVCFHSFVTLPCIFNVRPVSLPAARYRCISRNLLRAWYQSRWNHPAYVDAFSQATIQIPYSCTFSRVTIFISFSYHSPTQNILRLITFLICSFNFRGLFTACAYAFSCAVLHHLEQVRNNQEDGTSYEYGTFFVSSGTEHGIPRFLRGITPVKKSHAPGTCTNYRAACV